MVFVCTYCRCSLPSWDGKVTRKSTHTENKIIVRSNNFLAYFRLRQAMVAMLLLFTACWTCFDLLHFRWIPVGVADV